MSVCIKPFALCMSGLSGSGKTTIAEALASKLHGYGIAVDVVDGDVTRNLLDGMLGYSRAERIKAKNVYKAIGYYLLRNKVSFILSVVAPYEEYLEDLRNFFGESYVGVYVKASLEECIRRDVKGLYKLNNEGKLSDLNGGDNAYEEPLYANITIDTERLTVDESVNLLMDYLINNSFIRC